MTWIHKKEDFPQLNDVVYLDHMGATLPSAKQLDAFHKDLKQSLYGNPHSRSASSSLCTETIDQARFRVLKHLGASLDTHSVIFTSGCTGALKLVAESFDWSGTDACRETEEAGPFSPRESGQKEEGGMGGLFYLQDNHTSVVGMRELTHYHGASSLCLPQGDVCKALGGCISGDQEVSSVPVGAEHGPPAGTQTSEHRTASNDLGTQQRPNHLFAYPAQSNFCGRKYPLDWAEKVKEGRLGDLTGCHGNWFVVLDAAAFVGTSPLDLSQCAADFVTVSFYKMFGFPTGLGALVVRNESAHVLKKMYFGGGTVMAYLASERFHKARTVVADRFEDGTLPFLDIISLRHGFDSLEQLGGGMQAISERTFNLAKHVHDTLANWQHSTGRPVAETYCHTGFGSMQEQGPIVNFNLLRPNGEHVGYAEVERLAALRDIHIRTGCFCNTGACQHYLHISNKDIRANLDAGHVCGDDMDLIDGRPTGSVRVSFGYMSDLEDANHFLDFIRTSFVSQSTAISIPPTPACMTSSSTNDVAVSGGNPTSSVLSHPVGTKSQSHPQLSVHPDPVPASSTPLPSNQHQTLSEAPVHGDMVMDANGRGSDGSIRLTGIYLYPIKSCGSMEVSEWELSEAGLKYDRQWMVVNEGGVYMSQKRIPKLCLIKPIVDLGTKTLTLTYPGKSSISLPLEIQTSSMSQMSHGQGKVCGTRVNTIDCGDEVASWLTAVIGQSCRLQQQDPNYKRKSKLDNTSKPNSSSLSLANQSQYLLVSKSSSASLLSDVEEAHRRVSGSTSSTSESLTVEELISRFRSNFVVEGCDAFDEESWTSLEIGSQMFEVKGRCNRCQMICINQNTGEKGMEPLHTLSNVRAKKIFFGMHVMNGPNMREGSRLRIGDVVMVTGRGEWN